MVLGFVNIAQSGGLYADEPSDRGRKSRRQRSRIMLGIIAEPERCWSGFVGLRVRSVPTRPRKTLLLHDFDTRTLVDYRRSRYRYCCSAFTLLLGSGRKLHDPGGAFRVDQSFWPRHFVVRIGRRRLERLWPHVRTVSWSAPQRRSARCLLQRRPLTGLSGKSQSVAPRFPRSCW